MRLSNSLTHSGISKTPTFALTDETDQFRLTSFISHTANMAHSLSAECTPLKLSYDSCFNSWFEGYLEPTLSPQQQKHKQQHPEEYAKQKAEEYQQKCGKIWDSYRDCVQKAIKEKGLIELLDQARDENPLNEPPPTSADPSLQSQSQSPPPTPPSGT